MRIRQERRTRGKGRWIKGFGPRKGEGKNLKVNLWKIVSKKSESEERS